jgi:hypothetical protein
MLRRLVMQAAGALIGLALVGLVLAFTDAHRRPQPERK